MALIGTTDSVLLTLEDGNGYTYRGKMMSVSFTQRAEFHGPKTWEATLRGWGDLTFSKSDSVTASCQDRFTSIEWFCEWCGSVHSSNKLSCNKCGASRTFLYELMQFAHTNW